MKARSWVQDTATQSRRVSSSDRNTTCPMLLPQTQPSKSTPPMASMSSRPSTSPAFAEALLQYLWLIRRSDQRAIGQAEINEAARFRPQCLANSVRVQLNPPRRGAGLMDANPKSGVRQGL